MGLGLECAPAVGFRARRGGGQWGSKLAQAPLKDAVIGLVGDTTGNLEQSGEFQPSQSTMMAEVVRHRGSEGNHHRKEEGQPPPPPREQE